MTALDGSEWEHLAWLSSLRARGYQSASLHRLPFLWATWRHALLPVLLSSHPTPSGETMENWEEAPGENQRRYLCNH